MTAARALLASAYIGIPGIYLVLVGLVLSFSPALGLWAWFAMPFALFMGAYAVARSGGPCSVKWEQAIGYLAGYGVFLFLATGALGVYITGDMR